MKRINPKARRLRKRKPIDLTSQEMKSLSKLLNGTDPGSPPSNLLRLLKTERVFRKSSYAEGGAILLVAEGGHRGAYTRGALGQMVLAAG